MELALILENELAAYPADQDIYRPVSLDPFSYILSDAVFKHKLDHKGIDKHDLEKYKLNTKLNKADNLMELVNSLNEKSTIETSINEQIEENKKQLHYKNF